MQAGQSGSYSTPGRKRGASARGKLTASKSDTRRVYALAPPRLASGKEKSPRGLRSGIP